MGGANVALAEESGGFIGIGVGYGGIVEKMTEHTLDIDDKYTSNGLSYGFVVGYKQFFNDYVGFRYYANVDIYHNMSKTKGETEVYKIIVVNYGVNVDLLYDFVVTEIADFGGFIGIGLGANTLTGKYIKDLKDEHKRLWNETLTTTGFDVWLNVGLRTNIAKYHGIEVVARVPFLPVPMDVSDNLEHTLGQEYSIIARYTFSF